MVLHIESFLSRRGVARLEAYRRAADIDVGHASDRYRKFHRQFERGRCLFPSVLQELPHGQPTRKGQSGALAASCQQIIVFRMRCEYAPQRFLTLVIAMIRYLEVAARCWEAIFPTIFPTAGQKFDLPPPATLIEAGYMQI